MKHKKVMMVRRLRFKFSLITSLVLILCSTLVSCSKGDPFRCIEQNDIPALKKIVDKRKINAFNDNGKTPLYMAIEKQNIEAVQALIENGADINLKNTNNINSKSALQFSISQIIGDNALGNLNQKQIPIDDPKRKILRLLLEKEQMNSGKQVSGEGKIQISMEMASISVEGVQLIAHIAIVTAAGSKDLAVSRFETKFTNFDDLSDLSGGHVTIWTGGKYWYRGIERNNTIELFELKLLDPNSGSKIAVPIGAYLPTSSGIIKTNSWMGDMLKRLGQSPGS